MPGKLKKLQYRANSIFVLTSILAIVLASVVYFNAENIRDNSQSLINNELPALSRSSQISLLMIEQERLLYEYYASQQMQLYSAQYKSIVAQLEETLLSLSPQADNKHIVLKLEQGISRIIQLGASFNTIMNKQPVDWDAARDQLALLSEHRRSLNPVLALYNQHVNQQVDVKYQNTQGSLSATFIMVVACSLLILLVVVLAGKYLRNYIMMAYNNERLALFPARNPNPVLSIDSRGKVTYYNPAANQMVRFFGLKSPLELINKDYQKQLKLAAEQGVSPVYENKVGVHFLSYQINWLADISAYDVHISDITAQKKAKCELEYQAHHHSLSGLYNSIKFEQDLDHLIETHKHFWLMLIELPEYGEIMANYGLTGASDSVRSFAKELSGVFNNVRDELNIESNIYHVADASFAILFKTEQKQADILAVVSHKITSRFDKTISTQVGEITVPLKIGISEYPNCSQNSEQLMLQAKIALDSAGSCHPAIRYFSNDLGEKHARQLDLIQRMQKAIQEEAFELYFQPQMDLQSRKIVGAEALIRWFDKGEFISPGEFIPLAEHQGLILELGDWILKRACQLAAGWKKMMPANSRIAVNISPRQFIQPGFVQKVKKVLDQTGLPPQMLELEVTEGIVMENHAAGIDVLHQLKRLGICLAIDDFGTGYSSLSYLKNFPVDKIKIDQSFIRNLHSNSEDQAIVLTLCQLGQNLNLKVIAEGVEEQEHLNILAGYECDEIQGYWYSRPLPVNNFEAFLHEHAQGQ
ncbi:GGDEF domain-containing phosphodiesterase [Gayadomonas joobiniege]|uniref:sensor domain-containing protein n=1 Tax=Gayadomonas joobiniege TaxID=1234606 RepID=UPI00036C2C1A|nr:GGDEF domain-containing phosphodiesterase [Gayadomonas joobiniege]